jgi:hypothetical protein
VDYDADGRLDLVTGSYTGQFYLFRRQQDGGFAQRELLVDEDGATLMMPFETVYSVTPELVDMDADGDLDLVVGNRSGTVQIVTNLGTRQTPKWSKQRRDLTTIDGKPIAGSNAHHADWDGDGMHDLIVGSEGGDVTWYRNAGRNESPRYTPGKTLVAARHSERGAEGSTPEHHGMRVKVHVTDWNEDGKVDLLVGDITWQESKLTPLTEAEAKTKKALEKELEELYARGYSTDETAQREAATKAIADVQAKLRPLRRTETHPHGWVWLYLRS